MDNEKLIMDRKLKQAFSELAKEIEKLPEDQRKVMFDKIGKMRENILLHLQDIAFKKLDEIHGLPYVQKSIPKIEEIKKIVEDILKQYEQEIRTQSTIDKQRSIWPWF